MTPDDPSEEPPEVPSEDLSEDAADAPDNLILLPGTRRPEPEAPLPEGVEAAVTGPVPAELLLPALEACLFACAGVMTTARLADALQLSVPAVEGAIEVLRERLVRTGSGVRLIPVAEGWQLRTDPRLATWVAAARGGKPLRLSRAAVETLSIIAFRQPVSKGSIDDIRGVDCGGVLRMLADRGLVRVTGRAEEPGRPLTWGTTPAFLELFGLRSLADLPTLRDLRALEAGDPAAGPVPIEDAPHAGRPAEVEAGSAAIVRMGELLRRPRLVEAPPHDPPGDPDPISG